MGTLELRHGLKTRKKSNNPEEWAVKGAVWLIVVSHDKRIRLPFHHMRSEKGRKGRENWEIIT